MQKSEPVKTADEMFGDAGYYAQGKEKDEVWYSDGEHAVRIFTSMELVEIMKGTDDVYLNFQEAKAIAKKLEELGW